MANIRAYKLAEELGIDRSEIVTRAAEVGIELKSPMAAVDDEIAQQLREKLGKPSEPTAIVTERRVQSGGAAVIRRRKKAAPTEPIPESMVEMRSELAPPSIAGEAEAGFVAIETEPEPQAEVEEAPVEIPEPEPAPPPPVVEREEVRPERPAGGVGGRSAPDLGDRSAGPDRSGRQRKLVREVVNLREQERLARQAIGRAPLRRQVTVDPRTATSPRRKRRDAQSRPAAAAKPASEQRRVLRIEGSISVGELARLLGSKAPDVQRRLMALGTMVSINQSIDVETAATVATDLGFEVQDVGFKEQAFFEQPAEPGGALELRPPVVTVMGHVDHGKTSLLDAIRHANVVAGEAGGITQHIGAYQARVGDHKITFIDTPGHAAFTGMRARGARVTDLVILVVAATEGIMPQTIEAIEHARAAGVPIVVAINKMDLPGANPQQVRQRLMEHGLVPEEFGGDTISVEVSAAKSTGLDKLLEMVLLQAEVLELRADPKQRASGVVLEASLDKGKGPVATVLVQAGTLRRGDIIVVGQSWGRVRAMEDEHAKRVPEATPSVPVRITGLTSVPDAGDTFHAVESERVAKEIVAHRASEQRERPVAAAPRLTLEEFFAQAGGGGVKELSIVLKADTQGSVEALRDSLLKLSTDAVKVDVLLAGVGAVTETDVMLAKASEGIVIGFHVRPDPAARRAAEGQGVEIRTYQVIYEVVDEVKKAMAGLLPPTISEKFEGRAEVRDTFSVPKVGTIAGCYVAEGRVRRGASCRLLRDGVQIYEGRVGSLKRFKDDVREVNSGFECGVGIDGYNDVKVGDVIETFVLEEKPATLE